MVICLSLMVEKGLLLEKLLTMKSTSSVWTPPVSVGLKLSLILLSHLHPDWQERFPQAVACEELSDEDPEEDTNLEVRGKVVRKTRSP